jgi:hypothetical protein
LSVKKEAKCLRIKSLTLSICIENLWHFGSLLDLENSLLSTLYERK